MSEVWYRKCDSCNAERLPAVCLGWWHLSGSSNSGYDFCSLACMQTWITSRAIARFSAVRTTGIHQAANL